MPLIHHLLDFILHIDAHLHAIIQTYGVWTYAILVLIIFCETGLVVTPFLPGDSLLFAVGALTALPDSPIQVGGIAALLVLARLFHWRASGIDRGATLS